MRLVALALAFVACDPDPPAESVVAPVPDAAPSKPSAIGPLVMTMDCWTAEIAPGDRTTPVVCLDGFRVQAWQDKTLTTIDLTYANELAGGQWIAPGRLGIGLDVIDLTNKSWVLDPALAPFFDRLHPNGIAWLPGSIHVALLFSKVLSDGITGDRHLHDLYIVSRTTPEPQVHRTLSRTGLTLLAAGPDRVLVSADTAMIFDLDGQVISSRALFRRGSTTRRASYGAGMFVIVGQWDPYRYVTLLDPKDGATIATWNDIGKTDDAVAIPHGAVAIDQDGLVHVGCLVGNKVQTVAQQAFKSENMDGLHVQVIGDRIAIADRRHVRIAKFNNPCS